MLGAGVMGLLMAAALPLAFRQEVTVAGPQVRLGQIADLSGLPAGLQDRAAAVPLVAVAPGRATVVSARRLAERARARMPVLAPWISASGDGVVTIHAEGPQPPAPTPVACLQVVRPVVEGAVVTAEDAVPAPCGEGAPATVFRFDRRLRAERALRALDPAERVRAPRRGLAAVAPGQRLYVSAQAGPVVVQREVEALQAAPAGGRLFVRALTGEVFAAVLPEARP